MAIPDGSCVVFLGDSITNGGAKTGGYIDQMGDALAAQYAVLNVKLVGAGVSGDNVTDLQKRFSKDVPKHRPTHVVIFTGRNDVGKVTKPEVLKPAYEAGLRDLVAKVRAINAIPVLVTPIVCGEKTDGTNPLDARLDEYADVVKAVAADLSCQAIDARAAFMTYLREFNDANLPKGILTTDMTHPTIAGYAVLADLFLRELIFAS